MPALLRKSLAILLPLLGLCGCSSDNEFTTNVAGNYTIAITNGASSCKFDNWVEGKETSGIGFVITEDGQNITGTLDGVTGALFTLLFGSADFAGTINGSTLNLTNYGSRAAQEGNCSYTYNSTVNATRSKDTIEGTITYSTKTNGNPDCAAVECSATQRFNGTRPPQ
jgi:hypothetical protein